MNSASPLTVNPIGRGAHIDPAAHVSGVLLCHYHAADPLVVDIAGSIAEALELEDKLKRLNDAASASHPI